MNAYEKMEKIAFLEPLEEKVSKFKEYSNERV